ncbi:hypothetical protein AB6A40_000984 [Gnathostoma spinigerum]|uniref:E3 ubiquitin protein ligase n=1 Tax=Gnathostoma spinigerum TaxID=75299 RepID=A0ABD6E462_9BILA
MSKRSSPGSEEDSPGVSGEEFNSHKKPRLVEFEPVRICSISGTADIDFHVLHAQHKKLSERFRYKDREINQLNKRVEQLERRQIQDDAMICIINRSWNRFDEDVRILLQRFDAETSLADEIENECEGTRHFLNQLSHWENDEIDNKLAQRVEFSRRAIAKLVQVFDHLTQRNEKIASMIASCPVSDEPVNDDGASTSEEVNNALKPSLNSDIAQLNAILSEKNSSLQKMITKLQSENHRLSTKVAAHEDELSMMETRTEEMSNSLEEVKYELVKSMRRECKLDYRLAEYVKKVQDLEMSASKMDTQPNGMHPSSAGSVTTNVNTSKLEELEKNLEMQTELAANRLEELQAMKERNKMLTKELETAAVKLKHTPPEVILNSPEYLALQAQFSVLLVEARQLRTQVETSRTQRSQLLASHEKEIEVMETEEALAQERMRDTMMELEEQLSQCRREYEMLRLEFEQNLSANEQSGPANKEMRMMLVTLKTQNQQLKQESSRFKRKWKEAVSSLAKCNKELESERRCRERCLLIELEDDDNTLASPDQDKNSANLNDPLNSLPDVGEDGEIIEEGDKNVTNSRTLQRYKKRLLELQSKLDSLNSLSSDQRDRVELMARERRLKMENEKMQFHLRKLAANDRREKMRYYEEEAQRKIRALEEQVERLRKEANSARKEEEGLMNEMETTGQAFEEMQEQNTKLLQQLKEKDDANLKLMAERIRANQLQKKMTEDKEKMEELTSSLRNQIEAQQLLLTKLEENEKNLLQKNAQNEHQLRMSASALDEYKRKATELSQTSADIKAQLEKCSSQLTDAQQAVTSKSSQQEEDMYRIRRLEEDKSILKKKLERAKKMEKVDNMDEVLNEEIRELKDLLTCPSCKVRRKDAILTKCFHVFCMECMKTRYETRRRKCPKCNAAFGANDYRRMYFT